MTFLGRLSWGLAALLVLPVCASAGEGRRFVFEMSGERSNIGSWQLIEQPEGTSILIGGGKTSIRTYGAMVSVQGSMSTLQVVCSEGELQALAVMPSGEGISFPDLVDKPVYAAVFAGDQKAGPIEIRLKDDMLQGSDFVLPLFHGSNNEGVGGAFWSGQPFSLKVITPGLDSILATYPTEGTKDALAAVKKKCNFP